MITINRILCPTDLSSESDEALRYAVALTSAYEAELLLLWCNGGRASTESIGHTAGVAPAPLFTSSLAPHLGLKSYSNLKWQGLVVNNVMDIGKTIVLEAEKHEVDLIVMRSRRRPHAAALLGSTAETVCRSAKCPVLITHPSEREWVGMSSGEIDIQRILVAYDFSEDSQVALKYGLSLAQEYQTEFHLLNVLTKEEQEGPEISSSPGRGNGSCESRARQLHAAIPKEAFLWCRVVNEVRRGKPYEQILAYAAENEIDLICIGGSGAHFLLGVFFGSNVDRVLRKAPCPVLVARPLRK